MHIVDLFPTLIGLAGGSLIQPMPLDGRGAWATIVKGAPSPHDEILLNAHGLQGAIRLGKWKLVRNGKGRAKPPVVELFDLKADPNEQKNVTNAHAAVVTELTELLDAFLPRMRWPRMV